MTLRKRKKPATPISLRAFARHRGVSAAAVSKAVTSGRLTRSVRRRKGQPVIIDRALADAEWTENARTSTTRSRRRPPTNVITLAEAQRRLTIERTKKLELERDVAEGRLIPKTLAAKEAFEAARIIREALLNLPARLAGELAADADVTRVSLRLEAAIREALDATCEVLLATVGE